MHIVLENVTSADLPVWLDSKKVCYQKYVDEYYGGWIDEIQTEMNTDTFVKAMQLSYFRKIVIDGKCAGFIGYDEQPDCIIGITIHMYPEARNNGIGSLFLKDVVEKSRATGKSAYLKVFKSNPARRLYERFGFGVYDENDSHYFMRYDCLAD